MCLAEHEIQKKRKKVNKKLKKGYAEISVTFLLSLNLVFVWIKNLFKKSAT